MSLLQDNINELSCMKKYPSELFFSGNKELLKKKKISIVGTRKPSKYTREFTQKLASSLSRHNICIVSGGAMGVDAMAHMGAGHENTIAVLPCGIDLKYPQVNGTLLSGIEEKGLLLSQFGYGFKSRVWTFVKRNELVVALGEVLVICEADLKSGSMRSAEFALEMGKEIYVLPHRLEESLGTQQLLESNKAKVIHSVEHFLSIFTDVKDSQSLQINDSFINFCSSNPSYDEARLMFSTRIDEAELNGEIEVIHGKVFLTK